MIIVGVMVLVIVSTTMCFDPVEFRQRSKAKLTVALDDAIEAKRMPPYCTGTNRQRIDRGQLEKRGAHLGETDKSGVEGSETCIKAPVVDGPEKAQSLLPSYFLSKVHTRMISMCIPMNLDLLQP